MKKSDNIILIGYRGTGKSVVAEKLQEITGKKTISIDQEIEKKYGTIPKIVQHSGWEKFREIETEILRAIEITDGIIDCGGGIIETPENIDILKSKGKIFWLKASVGTIQQRLTGETNRPSLSGEQTFLQEVETILRRRNPIYRQVANYEIETEARNVEEIAGEILNIIKPKTKICIPIVEKNIDDAKRAILSAGAKADLIELRVDYLEKVDERAFEELLKSAAKPLIITCRLESQGGTGRMTAENRQKLLAIATKKNVDFIDLEFDSDTEIFDNKKTKIIFSYHDFQKTPEFSEIQSLIQQMRSRGEIIKYIPTANSINDNFRIFKLLQENKTIISFCMGLKGQISRVLAGKYGSFLTFAAESLDRQSASGQILYDELVNLYNFHTVDTTTKVYGLLGQFAEDSKSKYMHNPAFQKNGVNALFLPFKIETEDELAEFMSNFREYNFAGAAVTIPYKETIIPFLNRLDDTAQAIGAVNTIKKEGDQLIGYNTDCIGAIQALREKIDLRHKQVLVIGAGGAARAIVYGLKQELADVTIANRTIQKAEKLAAEFSAKLLELKKIPQNQDKFDIFINTTSVGMYPNSDRTVINSLPRNRVVMDIVYKPMKTKLLKIAESAECEIITGEKMLIHQAIAQQKIWTGKEPEFTFMRKLFFDAEQ